jgi:hypothetical protein
MRSVKRKACFLAICLSLQFFLSHGAWAQPSSDCEWKGLPIERVLARHPPAGAITGSLGSDVTPFLQAHGVPVSFVSAANGEADIRIEVGPATTVRGVLGEIERQAPKYHYRAVDGRVVIYPRDEAYDVVVDLGPLQKITRAGAYLFVLGALRDRDLRQKATVLSELDLILKGAGPGGSPLADEVEVGGRRSVIEHLVSLIRQRPSIAFKIVTNNGKSYFSIVRVDLVKEINVQAPAAVVVGDTFVLRVTGTLDDGTIVPLSGPWCGVTYSVSAPGVVDIDGDGRAVARKNGAAILFAHYEHHMASAEVHIR